MLAFPLAWLLGLFKKRSCRSLDFARFSQDWP